MNEETYQYKFGGDVPMDQVEETLLLATLAVECLLGRSGIRLDAAFDLDPAARRGTISATTEAGKQIAKIFTGFLAHEFGEETFEVERVASDSGGRP